MRLDDIVKKTEPTDQHRAVPKAAISPKQLFRIFSFASIQHIGKIKKIKCV